jgi:hypothetical protein
MRACAPDSGIMTDSIILILLTGMAFVAGAAVTLIVSERSMSTRRRRQALRQRELTEFSAFINDRLAQLTKDRDPHRRRGP